MGCPCETTDTCGCFFTASGGIIASGVGTEDNPLDLHPADGAQFVIPCTSSTRPSAPSKGQFIYETDTGRVRVWNSTRWRLISADPNSVEYDIVGSALVGTTTGAVTVNIANVGSPWDSGDHFLVDARTTVVVAGSPGATWDLVGYVNGVEADADRIGIPDSGWGTGKVQVRSRDLFTHRINLVYVGGGTNYETFDSPATRNMMHVRVTPD